jgi:hypothetical protein
MCFAVNQFPMQRCEWHRASALGISPWNHTHTYIHDASCRRTSDVRQQSGYWDTQCIHVAGLYCSVRRTVECCKGASKALIQAAWSGVTHWGRQAHACGKTILFYVKNYGTSQGASKSFTQTAWSWITSQWMHESAEVILAIPVWVQGRRSTQRDALACSLNARPQSFGSTHTHNIQVVVSVLSGDVLRIHCPALAALRGQQNSYADEQFVAKGVLRRIRVRIQNMRAREAPRRSRSGPKI